MAGRSGFGSTATMIVTNTLAKDLAYTNFAYCSPSDLWSFSVSGSKLAFALVGDSFVLSVSAHESIPNGHIALNAIQRRHAKVSTGDTVSVSRFIPPDDFNLALLTLELEFVKKGMKDEQVDAVLLAQQIRKRFINQVMTTGQRVTIEYHGNGYIFTVNQAGVEGQVKSNSMDSIVNQLLTKIDGVESLNNVLLIGMTNRKDLLDEALLRPGRLEVQVEISLPDEHGRLQILQIHTNKMKENCTRLLGSMSTFGRIKYFWMDVYG